MKSSERKVLGLKAEEKDDKITRDILQVLSKEELTVDRASRILADAQIMLPLMSKLSTS